jgi:hypothetical protein
MNPARKSTLGINLRRGKDVLAQRKVGKVTRLSMRQTTSRISLSKAISNIKPRSIKK